MPKDRIEALSDRGEQLTRVLISVHFWSSSADKI
jgi:hypothetical protein